MARINFAGHKKGKWTVLEQIGNGANKRASKWRCLCECGTEAEYTGVGISKFTESSSCGCARSTFIPIGGRYESNSHGYATVLEKLEGSSKAIVQFDDGTIVKVNTANLRNGGFTNPMAPTFSGKGFIGQGEFSTITPTGERAPEYSIWESMLKRVYKWDRKKVKNQCYAAVTISDEWHNLQNFAAWCHTQVGFNVEGFHLEKDLLVKGNKHYSCDYCVFVPMEINMALTKRASERGDTPLGVYYRAKTGRYLSQFTKNSESVYIGSFATPEEAFEGYRREKEIHLKELAEKWKDKIDVRAYNALMAYTVEITD